MFFFWLVRGLSYCVTLILSEIFQRELLHSIFTVENFYWVLTKLRQALLSSLPQRLRNATDKPNEMMPRRAAQQAVSESESELSNSSNSARLAMISLSRGSSARTSWGRHLTKHHRWPLCLRTK